MGSDAIAAIRPALREFNQAIQEAEGDLCVTFEASGNEALWVQVMRDTLNFAYPLETDPAARLEPLLSFAGPLVLESWEAKKFATLHVDSSNVNLLAKLIDALFVSHLGADSDYDVDVSMQWM